MLQINLFRSPLNTQSETIYIEATQKAIKDCLDIDFEYALIYVNGYQVDKDYILKEDDVCTIRQTHGLITSLVTGIQAAVNGRSFTDQWDSNKKDIQKKISDWLAEGNEEPDAPTNKNVDTTTQTIPQLAGAKNASAYGKYVPLVLGRSIYTSNYCGNQYRTISGTDGEKQTFHCLYLLGYKDIQVQDIKLGMTLLSSNPNLRDNGVFQNSEIDGRWDAETYNIQLELEQGSDVSIYPQKVSEEQLNIELLNTGTKKLELNRFSAKNPQTIEIEFTLNGLIGYSENGDEQEKSVQVQIKISFDGGTTYEPFGQIVGTGITYDSSTGVSTITRKKNKVMRFIATRTLTASEALSCENGVAELYIARNNAQAEGNNQFDKIYLSGIRTWCFDPKLSTSSALVAQKPVDSVRTSLTARLGISIEADEIEFKGQLEALNCILTAKGRTYSNGSWSSTLSPTTNPASMALLVLQHPSRGKYAYTDSQIDMDAFGEFYEWCNQPREQGDNTPKFQCNGVMTAKKKTKDYIDAILDCGRGSFLYNSRKISVWIDKPRDTPVMVLNNQNILSQQNNKTLDDLPDGYKCKFVNEITWQTDEWDIIINPNAGANPVYESIDLIFQTNPKQIYQNMMYLYAKNKLRPETWKPRVSVDGNLLDIGSLIEIQNDTLSVGIGDGAEIKELVTDNGYITQIKTDGNMYIDDLTQEYGIKVTCADGVHEPKVMTYKVVPSATGEQSVFTFDTPILESATYKPNVGDIISFGFLDRITTQALCFGKKDNGDGTFDLTLVPYQEGVYTADSGEIPDFKTNVSNVPERDRGSYEPNKDAELLADANQRIFALAQATSHLYSNHIVTLYKESTLPLDSTGITGTCTYNFSTNGISWEGDNNGWTLTKPVTNNPVYVTSATAFGKQETDDILPNEWASPIQLGLNGTNGVNTCTLNLYKRLSETPSNYPSTLTYNFLTGSLLGEKNGWQESIPEVDETDNAPCWEIHVTALSTTTTDTIEPSEWTNPAKITQDGYSKEEIMSWIEDVQIESPNIYVNPNTGIFAVDDDGIIQAEQSVNIEVKVIQTNEEIDFDFGAVTVPDGFSIVANNHILTLTAQEGTRVTNSYFTIPIVFTRYESNYQYGDTEGNIYVRLNCQDGQWYGDINSVSNLPAQSNNNYFLWTAVDTQSTEEVVEGGVFKQNTYYYSNGAKFKEASYIPYGMSIPSPTSEVFNSSFGITTVYGGTYHEAKNTVASIPSNPIIGDFFTWTGTDQTSASIVQGGKLLTGCVYKWVGNEWIKDTSAKHRAVAMKELMSVAENKLEQNNSDVIDYIYELITMNVVTQNIQVTGEALIDSTITAKLTLGKQGDQTGYFRSWNYSNTNHTGFSLDTDGKAVLNEVTVRGDITANSFTLGANATITKGNDTSGHSYFGLASDGTLKVRNINAVSGSFTGDITANSFTLGASATIIKGTNTSGHSYFGLASDGQLTVRNINAVSGTFAGDVTANSFTLGANATITKGQNDAQHSYFGLASDGTLTVRQINAIGGNFENIIITGNSRFYGFISRTTSTYIFPPQATSASYDYELVYLEIQFLFNKLGITENGNVYKFYGNGLTMFWKDTTQQVFILTSDISMYKDYIGTTYNIEFDTVMFVDKELKYYNNKVYIKYTPEELQWYSTQSTLRYDTVGDMACGIKV